MGYPVTVDSVFVAAQMDREFQTLKRCSTVMVARADAGFVPLLPRVHTNSCFLRIWLLRAISCQPGVSSFPPLSVLCSGHLHQRKMMQPGDW